MSIGIGKNLRDRVVLTLLWRGITSPQRAEELLGRELTEEERRKLRLSKWRDIHLGGSDEAPIDDC